MKFKPGWGLAGLASRAPLLFATPPRGPAQRHRARGDGQIGHAPVEIDKFV